MSESLRREAKKVASGMRESQMLNQREDSLMQALAANGQTLQDFIHMLLDPVEQQPKTAKQTLEEIPAEGLAELYAKRGLNPNPIPPISKAQQMLNTITDDEWKKIYELNAIQMETAEGKNFTSKGIIENSAPLDIIKLLTQEEMSTTEPTEERKSRSSGVSLEKLQNMPSAKLAEIYERMGLKPIKESTLEKFKDKITDLVERIDGYVYDKAHSTGKSVKATFQSFKEKVSNKIQGQKSVQPQSRRQSSEHSR